MPLEPETDSSRVSQFHFLLYSQLADFELHFELLTNGGERLAGILEDVLDSAVSGSVRLLRHCSSRPHVVREQPFLPAFPLWTLPWPVQLQHESHHELLAHTLEPPFQCLFVGSSKRFRFALSRRPANTLLQLRAFCLLCEVLCSSPWRSMKSVHDQLASRKGVECQ